MTFLQMNLRIRFRFPGSAPVWLPNWHARAPRGIRRALRTMTLALLIVSGTASSTWAQGASVHWDDQIPWGPEGTIGRGATVTVSRWRRMGESFRQGGIWSASATREQYSPWVLFAPPRTAVSSTAAAYASPATTGVHLTNLSYEPGDGYRYPLYYNPATGTYVYYPVRR